MIYLTGAHRRDARLPEFVGVLLQPRARYHGMIDGSFPWASDTGLFNQPISEFDLGAYLDDLGKLSAHRASCLFVNAPDVVGDAIGTLAAARPTFRVIREHGWPVAFVAQDGFDRDSVPWDEFDALFIGGTTEWKLGPVAEAACREAKARGKWLHMGRVNSSRRLRMAANWGCDSVDGTFLKFGPDKNLPRLVRWFDQRPLRFAV